MCKVIVRCIGSREIALPITEVEALSVTKTFNAKPVSRATGLWIEDRGGAVKKSDIKRLPRVGVDYAGEVWAGKKYRFRVV